MILSACASPERASRALDAAGSDARQITDAGPLDAENDASPVVVADAGVVVPDERSLAANAAWIGGVCDSDRDCTFAGGRCQLDGQPYGTCTRDCSLTCPDQAGAGFSPTFCIDGSWAARSEGACVTQCDATTYGASECPIGFHCVDANRYSMPATTARVCAPLPNREGCDEEDLLVELSYPDDGALFIPREALCSGEVDVVLMLHGINGAMHRSPSIGGPGRRLEYLYRQLIDRGQMQPVAVAEPVHLEPDSSTLYGSEFDPTTYVDMVKAALLERGVTVLSLSALGHSGAGCNPNAGLYKIASALDDLIPARAPEFRLLGLEDICYGGAYHYRDLDAAFEGRETTIVNMWTSMSGIGEFEPGFLSDSTTFECNNTVFSSCKTDGDKRFAYRTRSSAGVTHNNTPYFFVREVFPRFFRP